MERAEADTEEVRAANLGFYRAFSTLDIQEMDKVWEACPQALCIHPGWPPLSGWEAIRRSWESIFENTSLMHFNITGAQVVIQGECSWVTCVENITSVVEGRALESAVLATNIFVRKEDDWRLLHHHASPLGGDSL